MFIYIYTYIWANYNNSLTWIVRPFGDDFPDPNHDSRARSQWGRYNLPRYIYIYIYSGSLDPNMWIPRWIYLYTYIYRWIYLYTYIYIYIKSIPIHGKIKIFSAVRITMEICRCPPFSAPWIGNWRKDPGEPRCDMEGPKKLIGQPWKMVVEWKFNQQTFGFHGISPTIGISWNLSSKHWRSNGISPKKMGLNGI